MKKTEFIFDGKEGVIYDDGDIYIAGELRGKLYKSGELYISGKQSVKLYGDGEIYIDGGYRGKLYPNGDIYIDGKNLGKVYKKEKEISDKKIVQTSLNEGSVGGGILAETGVLGLVAVFFGSVCVGASYIMWTDQLWKTFERYMEIGWRVYLAKGMFIVLPTCGLLLQIYKSVNRKLKLGSSFLVGILIQSLSIFICLTSATCLIDGVDKYIVGIAEISGWEILIIIFACICMALVPAGVGGVIGILIKKLYWNIKRDRLN